jgi:hypothetical protein
MFEHKKMEANEEFVGLHKITLQMGVTQPHATCLAVKC